MPHMIEDWTQIGSTQIEEGFYKSKRGPTWLQRGRPRFEESKAYKRRFSRDIHTPKREESKRRKLSRMRRPKEFKIPRSLRREEIFIFQGIPSLHDFIFQGFPRDHLHPKRRLQDFKKINPKCFKSPRFKKEGVFTLFKEGEASWHSML